MGMALKRGIIIVFGLCAQICLYLFVYLFFINHVPVLHIFVDGLALLLALWLIKNSKNYSYTLPWLVIILLVPIVGALLYFILGYNKKNSKTLKSITKSEAKSKRYLVQNEKTKHEFRHNSKLRYITNYSGYPVTRNNDVVYYPLGEEAFEAMLKELKKAKKFIFIEYFIIDHGKMWNSILEVLKEKVGEGVEVRVMYDDLGSITTLDESYPKKLGKYGIKCIPFNHLNAVAGVIMNNRDHRKIMVIDGKVAFSGGINIADEYINAIKRFGHWKDNGIKVSGDAVWSYTVMFLTIWNAFSEDDDDFTKYKYEFKNKQENKSYVAPYGESPLDLEGTGEDVYLNIINQANKYVYIFTPYLIIDTDMINALSLCAKRGVDVRIVIPGVPDKKLVYTVSESYVEPLVKAGVKVYRYTPGFIHSKVFVSDDHIATVGTINMDYRSLYLHFECGCYIENHPVVKDVKKDALETLEKSHEITKQEAKSALSKEVWQAFLRLLAPLM